jgi:hypothetical protein
VHLEEPLTQWLGNFLSATTTWPQLRLIAVLFFTGNAIVIVAVVGAIVAALVLVVFVIVNNGIIAVIVIIFSSPSFPPLLCRLWWQGMPDEMRLLQKRWN